MKLSFNTVKLAQEFTEKIQELINDGHDYIESVIIYCEKNGIEVESVASLVKNSPKLKSSIKEEAENLNLMKKKRKLPL